MKKFLLVLLIPLFFSGCSLLGSLFSSPPQVRMSNPDSEGWIVYIGIGTFASDTFTTDYYYEFTSSGTSSYNEIEQKSYDIAYNPRVSGQFSSWYVTHDNFSFENNKKYTITYRNSSGYAAYGTITITED